MVLAFVSASFVVRIQLNEEDLTKVNEQRAREKGGNIWGDKGCHENLWQHKNKLLETISPWSNF